MPLQGIRARLLFTILLASVLPLTLGGLLFFALVNQTITTETFQKVAFARDAKSSEISQYLTYARRQAENLAQSANVRYSVGDFYGFSHAIRQMQGSPEDAGSQLRGIFGVDGTQPPPAGVGRDDRLLREALEYSNTHRRFHAGFLDFLNEAEFDNLYLVDRHGLVVYSVHKDAYLGRILPPHGAGLGQAYHRAVTQPGFAPVFQDYGTDALTGVRSAYLAVPVRLHGRSRAAMILRMPPGSLQSLLGSGETALTVLSTDGMVIASSGSDASAGSLARLPTGMDGDTGVAILEAGLAGGPSLSAWSRLPAPAPAWQVVAEASRDAAFENSRRLRNALLLVGAVTAALLGVMSLYFSNAITRPVRRLAEAASSVATGSLNEALPEYDRPLEYARLSRAVNQMRRALRDQLDLIRDKNDELQENLRQIGEKNAELKEADRIKDRFLANTSHELRTPLNGIIGILETLEGGAMGDMLPAQKSQLRLITFSARRLSRLVDDLLDIYRIREGRMRLDLQPVDITHSLRNVLQLVQPMFQPEPVEVTLDIPNDLPAVTADPVRYEQILFNLISNAVKYGGGRPITISAQQRDGQLVVSVRDQGPGIAADSMERIFHPLEQLTPGSAGQQSGSGLGLTIARNLAVLMSGTIEVSSAEGQGAMFSVALPVSTLPAMQAADDWSPVDLPLPITPEAEPRALNQTSQHGDAPTILAVDDEPINLQVLQNVLHPQGYRVVTAPNGAEALRRVAQAKPDLIVLDVMMAGLSGLEVARTLRRRHGLHELPIILLTARGRTSDMLAGFEAGANDYVVKPFVKDELLSRIRTLLEASRAHSRAEENLDLREEIERRIQIEDALRLSQRRMTQLLDTLEDGLICVNARGIITYVNGTAAQMLGHPITANQTVFAAVLPDSARTQLETIEAADDPVQIELELNGATVQASVFAMMPEAGGGRAVLLGRGGALREGFVHSLRDMVDTSLPSLIPADQPDNPVARPGDSYRETIVELMTESLDLWGEATGEGKIAFAEASGIWRVNLDKTSLQTRTLDKYLLLETLPDNPRWRDVLKTASFTLALENRASVSAELQARFDALESRLEEFRSMIAQRG